MPTTGTKRPCGHEGPASEDLEDLPSAAAIEAEYSLYCAGGEPHPMDLERGEARCSCDRCSRWDRFVRGEEPGGWRRYEVLTTELVAGLAAWLRGVTAASSHSSASPLRVLEVGAGDGRLTQSLKRALADCPVWLAATDSFASGLRAVAPVETLGYQEALAQHAPDVVQHGQSDPLAVPQQLGSCGSSGRAWWPRATRHSQSQTPAPGHPATASAARASRLQSRRFHCALDRQAGTYTCT